MTRVERSAAFAGTIAACLHWPCASRASAFATARFTAEHGNVTTTSPTALYFNPAGIAFSTGTHVLVDGTLALRRETWEHAPAPTDRPDPPGAEGADSGKAQLLNVLGSPMAGITTKIGDLAMGGAVYVPFGGSAHWDKNERFANSTYPLAADGVQRWHGIDGSLSFVYFTAGVAYRFGPVSLGVTANLIRSSVMNYQAKNPTGNGDVDIDHEGRVTLDVSGWQGSFGVGTMIEVAPTLWLGASYQAQPAVGAMELGGTLATEYRGGIAPSPVTFHQALPDITRLGARYRASEKVELRLSVEFTRWSVMQTQCVVLEGHPCVVDSTGADTSGQGVVLMNLRRHWKDTWAIRPGVSFWPKSELELFAGLGFETAATPDETVDPHLPDGANFWGTLGARIRLGTTWFLAPSYTHIKFLNRDNTGASQLADAVYPTRRPDGGGKYTAWIGALNVNLETQF
jgi:long-chain fatty acid transport protein